jgi:hypothetical protein
VRDWLNKYGKPFADYELRAIEQDSWFDRGEANYLLGYSDEELGFGRRLMACDTCGSLFTEVGRHLRSHRRLCGWDNGAPAVADA